MLEENLLFAGKFTRPPIRALYGWGVRSQGLGSNGILIEASLFLTKMTHFKPNPKYFVLFKKGASVRRFRKPETEGKRFLKTFVLKF